MKSSKNPVVWMTVLLILSINIIGTGQNGSKRRDPTLEEINQARKEAVDLREMIKSKRLREGINLVYTDKFGSRISARVKDGVIVEWLAADKKGKRLPTMMYKGKGGGGKDQDVQETGPWMNCEFCTVTWTTLPGLPFPSPRVSCQSVPCGGGIVVPAPKS